MGTPSPQKPEIAESNMTRIKSQVSLPYTYLIVSVYGGGESSVQCRMPLWKQVPRVFGADACVLSEQQGGTGVSMQVQGRNLEVTALLTIVFLGYPEVTQQ